MRKQCAHYAIVLCIFSNIAEVLIALSLLSSIIHVCLLILVPTVFPLMVWFAYSLRVPLNEL